MTVLLRQGRNYWASPPASFHSFAEWAENPKETLNSVKDTGPSLRAFLPILSPETRTSLKTYEGIGDVFDTRVFCSRPNSITFDKSNEPFKFRGTLVHGNVTDEIGQILRLPNARTSTFDFVLDKFAPGSFLFVQLDTAAGGMFSSVDPLLNSALKDQLSFDGIWTLPVNASGKFGESRVELGHAFLFLVRESYSTEDLLKADPSKKYYVETVQPGSELDNGVWLEYPRDEFNNIGGFNITVCYDAL